MAVVLDEGSVSRNGIREKEIRKRFVEDNLISAVILLPENLFYNTSASSVIIVMDKDKKAKGEILMINASQFYQKEGRKNRLTQEGIEKIVEVYREWKAEKGFSKIITKEKFQTRGYSLSPSYYIFSTTDEMNREEWFREMDRLVAEYLEVEKERKEAEERLKQVLFTLGLLKL
jgi:type I restriction enzyme M protein